VQKRRSLIFDASFTRPVPGKIGGNEESHPPLAQKKRIRGYRATKTRRMKRESTEGGWASGGGAREGDEEIIKSKRYNGPGPGTREKRVKEANWHATRGGGTKKRARGWGGGYEQIESMPKVKKQGETIFPVENKNSRRRGKRGSRSRI